jgi:hypothetical protein
VNAFRVVAVAALAWLAACTSVDVKQHAEPELAMLRTMGYRVAVLPFVVSAPEDGFFSESLAPVGEVLALEASREAPMREQIGELAARAGSPPSRRRSVPTASSTAICGAGTAVTTSCRPSSRSRCTSS